MAQLLAMLTVTMIPKYTPMYLTDYLTHSEFRCKCHRKSCHFTIVAPSLLESYGALRVSWGKPITVNSGFRCMDHNRDIMGSSETSSHTSGFAIDLKPESGDLKDFYDIAMNYFDTVILYPTFIHCHNEGK